MDETASTAEDPVIPPSSASAKLNAQAVVRHQCQVCSKQYERLDHLRRHELSHQNPRHHACPRCPRRFNRRDLLSRHLTTHDCSSSDGITVERAAQACVNCISSKTKCGNQRPCYRCKSKGLSCFDSVTRKGDHTVRFGPASADKRIIDEQTDAVSPCSSHNFAMPPPQPPSQNLHRDEFPSATQAHTSARHCDSSLASRLDASLDISGMFMNNMDITGFAFPDSLIAMPQDVEFGLDEALQSLHADSFLADVLSAQSPSVATGITPEDARGCETTPCNMANNEMAVCARNMGYESFKESPWLWVSLDRNRVCDATSTGTPTSQPCSPVLGSFVAPRMQNIASRDELLSLALKFSTTVLKVRSFPSLRLLNIFIEAFFVRQDDSSDSWIHQWTFNPDRCRSEFLAGLVAAGSTFFAVPNVWKMGMALQEITRISVCRAVDDEYGLIHNLQINQAFLMWIEISVWSGFRRRMEIGEGFSHTLPTMLRATGAFRQTHYLPESYPSIEDEGESLRAKWTKWVEQESLKRLVLRCLINEMQCSIAFGHGPVWSGLEIGFFLPASRDLWDASCPEQWQETYIYKRGRPVSITLVDAMRDASKLEDEREMIDMAFCALSIMYGFWGRVWSFLESRKYTSTESGGPANLWVEAHRHELLDQIQTTTLKLEFMHALSPEARLVSEFLLMSLYTCADETRKLASWCGGEESRRALPRFRGWTRDEDRYCAIWHAGQVIRAARSFPLTHLKGFYAIAVFHASLCFWMFTMQNRKSLSSRSDSRNIECDERDGDSARSGSFDVASSSAETQTSSRDSVRSCSGDGIPEILLDGEETADLRTFLQTGYGRPLLHADNGAEELGDPGLIPRLVLAVFRSNYPANAHPLPPLLESLASMAQGFS